jgi:signal transduction histidine kinase
MITTLPTECAPAERAAPAELQRQAGAVTRGLGLDRVTGTIPVLMMILNAQRQIVYANRGVLTLLNLDDADQVCGTRPGEAFHCIRAAAAPGGCGTSIHCRTCGALQAILAAQRGAGELRECRIATVEGGALDLRVWATPVEVNHETYTLLSVQDISDEKRRRALERIFFHDIMNAAVGLRGLSELLEKGSPEDSPRFRGMLHDLAGKLIEDIQAQRDLANAENQDLVVHPAEVKTSELVSGVVDMCQSIAVAHRLKLAAESVTDAMLTSDKVLLRRVLGNLVKNAIEASRPDDTVSVSCRVDVEGVQFEVKNPAVIPQEIQSQLFQRSFSTKGEGRGLGTYSIKLYTERYLKGSVSFSSVEGEGTVFRVRYPWVLEAAAAVRVDRRL